MNRTRLLLLAAAGGVAAVIVVVALLVSGGGSSSTTTTTTQATTQPQAPTATLAGVPQHGDVLGKTSAPATMLVFEDPQCPYCMEWNTQTLSTVVDGFVRTGKLKLEYRGIEIIGPNSLQGLRAIYAAGLQNRAWNMSDAIYARQGAENSGWITTEVIRAAAKDAGANPDKVIAQMSSKAVDKLLILAATEANETHVNGTPTFIILRPLAAPQQLSVSSLDPVTFTAALSAALK